MAGSTEDRLLPGEDPATPDLEDAQLRVQVYKEMIMVKLDLITRLDGHLAALSGPARDRAGGNRPNHDEGPGRAF